MRGQRRLLVVYVAVATALPTWGLVTRWVADVETTRWSWHMFSTLP